MKKLTDLEWDCKVVELTNHHEEDEEQWFVFHVDASCEDYHVCLIESVVFKTEELAKEALDKFVSVNALQQLKQLKGKI